MVKIAICGGGQLEGSEADVVKGLVVDTEGFVRVFNQLMHGERRIVGLHNSVGHLHTRGRHPSK